MSFYMIITLLTKEFRFIKAIAYTFSVFHNMHGSSHRLAIEGVHHGVTYRLCAADYTNFAPIRLR